MSSIPARSSASTTLVKLSTTPRTLPAVIVEEGPWAATSSQKLGDAFSSYFRYSADRLVLDLRELFRIGRRSLLIGMSVLAGCVVLGQFLAGRFEEGYINRFFNEGLIILGWVANWRPLEIFLYEWWPLVRRRELYRRLSVASIRVRGDPVQEAEPIRPSGSSRN